MKRLISALTGRWSSRRSFSRAGATAATDSSEASILVDAATQLQSHTTANCVAAEGRCYFTATANLMTPRARPIPRRLLGPADRHGAVPGPRRLAGGGVQRPDRDAAGKPGRQPRQRPVEDVPGAQQRRDIGDLFRRRPAGAVRRRRDLRAQEMDRRTARDRLRTSSCTHIQAVWAGKQPGDADHLQPDPVLTPTPICSAVPCDPHSQNVAATAEQIGRSANAAGRAAFTGQRQQDLLGTAPAMVRQRVLRKSKTRSSTTSPPLATVPSGTRPGSAGSTPISLRALACGPGIDAADRQLRDALIEQRTDLRGHDERPCGPGRPGRGRPPALSSSSIRLPRAVPLRHRDALVGQRRAGQPPAVVDGAEPPCRRARTRRRRTPR